jgi:flagellar export protein FliJ
MQGFRFRLDRVLEWQRRTCRLEEDELRQCRSRVAATEERIAQLKAESIAVEGELTGLPLIAAADLRALSRYRVWVNKSERALERERQVLLAAAEQQQKKLLDQRRRLRQIETLRERALREFTQAHDRELETLALECHLSARQAQTSGQPI